MLTKPQHVFDDAPRVVAGDTGWQGRTSPDYWAFVGPFGGFTAATILRALIEHPQRAGDPVAVTVNFCAPIAEGDFDLDVRLIKANRSSQHWYVELSQAGGDVASIATAVFAERRPSWSHQVTAMPESRPFEDLKPYRFPPVTWVGQYDLRFIDGYPAVRTNSNEAPGSAFSKLWIADRVPRTIDHLSLTAMSDAFFARIFHAGAGGRRRQYIPSELLRSVRQAMVTLRATARDHDADHVFQGVAGVPAHIEKRAALRAALFVFNCRCRVT